VIKMYEIIFFTKEEKDSFRDKVLDKWLEECSKEYYRRKR